MPQRPANTANTEAATKVMWFKGGTNFQLKPSAAMLYVEYLIKKWKFSDASIIISKHRVYFSFLATLIKLFRNSEGDNCWK